MDSNALPNILTIGPVDDPILTLYNNATDGNGDQIESIGGVFGVDVIGDTLSIDEIDAVVHYGGPLDVGMTVWEVYLGPGDEVYLDPDGESIYAKLLASVPDGSRGTPVDLRALPFGTPVRWTHNGKLIAAFYLRSVDRVGRYLWKITACSGVGLLDKSDHAGGLYSGKTFAEVAAEIIGGSYDSTTGKITGGAFPCTVAASLADQKVYGWLPYDTRRNNMHQLLFAMGASLRRDANGEALLVFLSAAVPQPVGDDRVSFGGSVIYETPATRAEVIEHAFFETAGDEVVTLFDNTGVGQLPASHELVRFDQPAHNLQTTGTLAIDDSGAACGVNWAKVTGLGTLTGKAYTHTMRVVAQDAAGATGEENVKHVDDYTLVSLACSLNVAKRVLSYYSAARTVGANLTLNGERCGDILSLDDPFLDPITAFLESISVNASTNLWGPARLVENYTPANQGNNVTGKNELQGAGTWVSPFTGTLQYVLISGAQGGCCGGDGYNDGARPSFNRSSDVDSDGHTITKYNYTGTTAPGNAGAGGQPGNGGRVVTGTISVTLGQQIAWHTGVGGAGEVHGSGVGHGSDGTDTEFGSITTENGTIIENGFFDPITGDQYGQTGDYGQRGGYPNETISGYGITGANAAGIAQSGRFGGDNLNPGSGSWYFSFAGASGGGPAYGGNGGDALQTTWRWPGSAPIITFGSGGQGADAQPPSKETVAGKGGRGGYGGGASGFLPYGFTDTKGGSITVNRPETLQRGGYGSDGGQGADGIILLYWGGN